MSVVNDHEYDIDIAPDTNNPRYAGMAMRCAPSHVACELTSPASVVRHRHRVWFYFSISNIPFKNFRILLHITNFSKSKSLYRDGMSPVVRSRLRPNWWVHSQRCAALTMLAVANDIRWPSVHAGNAFRRSMCSTTAAPATNGTTVRYEALCVCSVQC